MVLQIPSTNTKPIVEQYWWGKLPRYVGSYCLVDENLGKYELALRAVHANFHYHTHRIFWMSYIPNSSNRYIDCVCCLNFRIYLFFVKASLSLFFRNRQQLVFTVMQFIYGARAVMEHWRGFQDILSIIPVNRFWSVWKRTSSGFGPTFFVLEVQRLQIFTASRSTMHLRKEEGVD